MVAENRSGGSSAQEWLSTYDRYVSDQDIYRGMKLKLWLLSTTPTGSSPHMQSIMLGGSSAFARINLPWEIRDMVAAAMGTGPTIDQAHEVISAHTDAP